MPLILEHIDAIARKKQRDVLFIEFHPVIRFDDDDDLESAFIDYDYDNDPKRNTLLAWLEAQGIAFSWCMPMASECGFGPYQGQLYIDLPMDEANAAYCLLRDHLEYPDGSMRDDQVRFYVLPLAVAMTNAHNDEPGFWKKWAEEF